MSTRGRETAWTGEPRSRKNSTWCRSSMSSPKGGHGTEVSRKLQARPLTADKRGP